MDQEQRCSLPVAHLHRTLGQHQSDTHFLLHRTYMRSVIVFSLVDSSYEGLAKGFGNGGNDVCSHAAPAISSEKRHSSI
jgi:hypothetical protein